MALLAVGTMRSALAGGLQKDEAIYQAQVPVKDQSASARTKAIRQAMSQVLVRLTGEAGIGQSPAAQAILKQSAQLMQSYSYVKTSNGQALQASFDPSGMKAAVKARHLPLWDAERPLTLVWLAVRGPNGRDLVSSSDAPDSAAGLVDTARARGIPLIFPLMDLQDQHLVSFSDVWGGFQQPVEKASQRYSHSNVLMADAQGGNGGWQVQWTLLRGTNQSRQWRTRGSSLNAALAAGANRLANFYAQRFAVVPGTGHSETQRVVVDGVDSMQELASVMSYLQGLTAIQSVHLWRIDGTTVTWRVVTDASSDYLGHVLGLSALLTPVQSQPSANGGAAGALHYRLANQS